ncbi:MAG: hypothetical protein M1829_006862 [Trizodia sp. TS-e1964]|nr:MAG: hypothetical protein M1829_006862 [Trizodia sp. TS-e1964]
MSASSRPNIPLPFNNFWFDAALQDLDELVDVAEPKLREKFLTRKAQALYALDQYRECCETLKTLQLERPQNIAAKEALGRAISRLVERNQGKYFFAKMQSDVLKMPLPYLDYATYVGPVAVQTSAFGRGLFTTQAIQAGQLLLCERAFCLAFENESAGSSSSILINTETNTMTIGTQPQLMQMLVQKLKLTPSCASAFTKLHAGSYKPVGMQEVDGNPIVDTFLAERIMTLNSFGCPRSSRDLHLSLAKSGKVFGADNTESKEHGSCGVWLNASYINHSCVAKVCRSFIGNMMIIRAMHDLPPDTELTISYKAHDEDGLKERQLKFQRQWGFQCTCPLCESIRVTPSSAIAQRKQLHTNLKPLFQRAFSAPPSKFPAAAKRIEAILVKWDKTYSLPASQVPRLGLWDPLLALAHMYLMHCQPLKTVQTALRVLATLGFVVEGGEPPQQQVVVRKWGVVVDLLPKCWLLLSRAYLLLSAPEMVASAKAYARTCYCICVGEDETFESVYGETD